jgi:hypothetical protein
MEEVSATETESLCQRGKGRNCTGLRAKDVRARKTITKVKSRQTKIRLLTHASNLLAGSTGSQEAGSEYGVSGEAELSESRLLTAGKSSCDSDLALGF